MRAQKVLLDKLVLPGIQKKYYWTNSDCQAQSLWNLNVVKKLCPILEFKKQHFKTCEGAKQHMYITKKWTKRKIVNYWREILLKLHFKALYYQTSLLLKLKRSQYRVAGKLLTENHWNTNKGIYQMCYEQNHPNPAGVEI